MTENMNSLTLTMQSRH